MASSTAYLYAHHCTERYEELKKNGAEFSFISALEIDDGEVIHIHVQPTLTPAPGKQTPAVLVSSDTATLSAEQRTACFKYLSTLDEAKYFNPAAALLLVIVTAGGPQAVLRTSLTAATSEVEMTNVKMSFIPSQKELFSRSKGILETGVLVTKSVAVVGLGSGGSPVCVELAKAGVGTLVLIDFDIIELSNVARHVCDTRDLGRKKTKAMADKVRAINPYINVVTYDLNVTEQPEETKAAIAGVDMVVVGTDNNESRFLLNQLCLSFRIPAVFGRVVTRGAGGDIVRVRPSSDAKASPAAGPCLSCIFTPEFLARTTEEVTDFKKAREEAPDYVGDDEVEATVQVGLSCDITPITNMMLKLTLLELSRGVTESGLASLEEDLVADFYMWANRREANFHMWQPLRFQVSSMSPFRWYGIRVPKNTSCLDCSPPSTDDAHAEDFF